MKPVHEWDEQFILQLPYGEFDWLEAKSRRALDLTLPSVKETDVRQNLSKALSAIANTGGGQLILGLQNPEPDASGWAVDDGGICTRIKGGTREWLETLTPNLLDFPLQSFNVYEIATSKTLPQSSIQDGRALYVIDVRDSSLAPHQALDQKYYARVGGRSVPIGHRLVLDIMGRRKSPEFELTASIVRTTDKRLDYATFEDQDTVVHTLVCRARNLGQVYAQYVNIRILLPVDVMLRDYHGNPERGNLVVQQSEELWEVWGTNTQRDVVDVETAIGSGVIEKYGPSWFDPILPGLSFDWEIELAHSLPEIALCRGTLRWWIYADNAPERHGETRMADIPIEV
jgi:hypothetical protein